MNQLIEISILADESRKNETDKDKYSNYETKLSIKNVDISDYEETGQVTITTSFEYENKSFLGDIWKQIYFSLEYDLRSEKEYEECWINDVEKYNVSKAIYFAIKSEGHKIYKFVDNNHILNIKLHSRELNERKYDDVHKIRIIYLKQIMNYERMKEDINHYTWKLRDDKNEYEINKKKEDHYNILCKKLVEEMKEEL